MAAARRLQTYTPRHNVTTTSTTHESPLTPRVLIARGADPIELAAKADPFGDQVHTILFVLWAVALPLGNIPWAKDVLFGGLIVWSVLRATVGHVDYAWAGIFRNPLALLLMAWVAWSSASLLWSPNPAFGSDQLGGLRMLAIPFVAWPVLRKWRLALGGFLVGGTLIGAGIVAQFSGWVDIPDFDPTRESRLSMSMGVWTAGLVCSATFIGHYLLTGIKSGTAAVVWHIAGGSIVIMAIVLNGTRSCWIALFIAGIGSTLILMVLAPSLRRRFFLIVTAAIAGLATAATIDDAFLDSRGAAMILRRSIPAIVEFQETSTFAVNQGTIHYRRKMWNGGYNLIVQRPLIGWGLGGFSAGLINQPGLASRHNPDGTPINANQFNPHSSYVYQAASTGLIGFGIMAGTLIVAICLMVSRIRRTPMTIVPLAMLSMWIVVSTFESTLLSGIGGGLLIMFLLPALATRPNAKVVAAS
jgi:O-antigen ligase